MQKIKSALAAAMASFMLFSSGVLVMTAAPAAVASETPGVM